MADDGWGYARWLKWGWVGVEVAAYRCDVGVGGAGGRGSGWRVVAMYEWVGVGRRCAWDGVR